jgi:hypothetical protein
MAERVDTARPRKRKYYNWDAWTDGSTWSATEGEDFTCSTANFQTALHQRARLEKMNVETGSPEPGKVEFRFTPKDGRVSNCHQGALTAKIDSTTEYYTCRVCKQPCDVRILDDSNRT